LTNLTGKYIDRYYIEEQLGEGGMATVYRAYDTRLERQVAIKVIRREAFGEEVLSHVLARFEREAKAMAQISHPNIVKVYDFGEHAGSPYLVMEYIPSGTLKDRIGQPMPWEEALRLILPLARALQYAHQQKIIHRDIKPGNILITAHGDAVLSDFGIAKVLEGTLGATLTGTGVGIGTPEYMAPEQGMGQKIDGRADQYALGVVLYELITGRKPYVADTPMAVVLKHITDPLPNPSRFLSELPGEVEWVVVKTLAKNPNDRYPDMAAFCAVIDGLLAGAQAAAAQVALLKPDSPPILQAEKLSGLPLPVRPLARSNGNDLLQATPAAQTAAQPQPQKNLPFRFKLLGALGLAVIIFGLAVGALALRRAILQPRRTAASLASPTAETLPAPPVVLAETPEPADTASSQAGVQTATPAASLTASFTPSLTATAEPVFGQVRFCATQECAEGAQEIFPEGSREVYFMFEYDHMRAGLEYMRRWYVNDILYLEYTCQWQADWPASGIFHKKVYDKQKGLAPGDWTIETYINDKLQDMRSFHVEGVPREEVFFESACPDTSPTLP